MLISALPDRRHVSGDDDGGGTGGGASKTRRPFETLSEGKQEVACCHGNGPSTARSKEFGCDPEHQAAGKRLHLTLDIQVRRHTFTVLLSL